MPRSRTAVALTMAMLSAPALAGCGGHEPATPPASEQGACMTPPPAPSTTALPDDIDLDALGTITRVAPDRDFVNARAVTQGSLERLAAAFSRALDEAGYNIVGSENEVVEADIYFSNPEGGLGAVKFIQGACEGRVVVELFIDR